MDPFCVQNFQSYLHHIEVSLSLQDDLLHDLNNL
nr:MAG TPA: hypothetical protein [Bacteriophage sp.]